MAMGLFLGEEGRSEKQPSFWGIGFEAMQSISIEFFTKLGQSVKLENRIQSTLIDHARKQNVLPDH